MSKMAKKATTTTRAREARGGEFSEVRRTTLALVAELRPHARAAIKENDRAAFGLLDPMVYLLRGFICSLDELMWNRKYPDPNSLPMRRRRLRDETPKQLDKDRERCLKSRLLCALGVRHGELYRAAQRSKKTAANPAT
jgi:hypothetical protein